MKTNIPCKITYSEADKCWYVESPGFYDSIMTYGDTLDNAKAMAKEAVTGQAWQLPKSRRVATKPDIATIQVAVFSWLSFFLTSFFLTGSPLV
ncbi:MAG: hypothetical protein LBT13_09390 [Treponema sp.]|jgi:hypothetical protein|nr:hypothetical protein [Treponema sp.]